MKIFTKKFFLLAIGMILSVGASAQTPTGAWNAYEDDGITHANPTVLYKRGSDPNEGTEKPFKLVRLLDY